LSIQYFFIIIIFDKKNSLKLKFYELDNEKPIRLRFVYLNFEAT